MNAMFDRKTFLSVSASTLFASAIGAYKWEEDSSRGRKRLPGFRPLSLKQIRIEAGAERAFRAIHVSDTHLVRADRTDNDPRKVELAARRYPEMGFGEHYLTQAIDLAISDGSLLLHTGDMIDFVSNANLKLAECYFGTGDWFVAAGNHEFSKYVGEAKEDAKYKSDSFARVSASYPNDLAFCSRVVNGINFVAADNVYYNFTFDQIERMEAEVKKGLPIIFMCHVPFYTPAHYAHQMELGKGLCSYQIGVPDRLVNTWRKPQNIIKGEEWQDRRVQQRADKATVEFIEYLKAQTLVKAVLCGHCHEFWEERFSPTAIQYVCSATYKGDGYDICIC